jgi:hypothetical protein
MTKRFLRAAVAGGLVLALGFLLGGCPQPTDDDGDSGPSAAQEQADEFKAAQSAVLGKTAETVALSDEEAVEAALAAYEALSANVKALLTEEKAKLDGLKAKIAELKAATSAEELAAEAFRTSHNAVLEKTAETISLGDKAAVEAALAAYEASSAEVKVLLAAEKAKLDGLKAKIEELPVFATMAGLQSWLEGQNTNDADSPYAVAYTGDETPVQIYDALNTADRFVDLDLSVSSVTGFDTGTEPGRAKIISLTLPDSLTATPDSTDTGTAIFRGFTNLKTIRAANVATVGQTSFRGLTSLTTVILPKATEIKQYAFSGCTSLTTVSLPKATEINQYAFYNCTNLATVDIPNIQTIGRSVFSGNTSLEEINLSNAGTIGVMVFFGCKNLTTVILGNTPPALDTLVDTSHMFMSIAAAASPKTITFKVPNVSVYTAAGSPWSDKIGANKNVGYYWDSLGAGKDYLTVALEPITP